MPKALSIPVGLLAVSDLLDRHPDRRRDILQDEIARREREVVMVRGTRHLFGFRVLGMVKAIATAGVSVFLLAWIVGLLAQLGQWVQAAEHASITVPIPLSQDFHLALGWLLPTSTVLETAAKLPLLDWRDAGAIALVAVAALFIERMAVGFLSWKKSRQLLESERELTLEIETLQGWLDRGEKRG